MRIVIATDRLAGPGGSQTYALTVAEHLSRLGHDVVLHAGELGEMGELARARGLTVIRAADDLPPDADGVIVAIRRGLAFALAERYPRAVRVHVVHGADETHLPPPLPDTVVATVVMNDLHAARARASPGAGETVRLRQPVDLRHFFGGVELPARPRRVLLLGNYHHRVGERADLLREAWSDAGLEFEHVGGENAQADPAPAIARADIVVGYGRAIVEAMAAARAAYVHDHTGTGGWVTADSYARLEAGGFALGLEHPTRGADALRADLEDYRPELGRIGHDLARHHHDARDHAAALVEIIERHRGERSAPAPDVALHALANLSEAVHRAELNADRNLVDAHHWHGTARRLEDRVQELTEAHASAEHTALEAREAADRAREAARVAAEEADRRIAAFRSTRRYRLAALLSAAGDRLKRRR